MDFRTPTTLGKTGLRVSRLGIGSGYGVPAAAVEKAYHEYGVNYLYWCLPLRYGMTAAIRHLAPAHRDKLVIAVTLFARRGRSLPGSVEKALRKLRIDYADVLLLAWHNRYPRASALEAAVKLKEQGTVRCIAMSGHERETFGSMAQRPDCPVDVFMVRYNAAHPGAETDVFPHLPEQNRLGVIAYTATCWGKLLKPRKMPPGEQPLTAPECYRFALSNPHVDVVLTGPKNKRQMDEALKTLDAGPLSTGELERMRRIGGYVHG